METLIEQLLLAGKIKVRFITIDVPAGAETQGIPVGGAAGGKCIGMRLQLPIFVRDTQTATQIAVDSQVIYYGDSDKQDMELTAIITKDNATPFLPCTDLNDIYVRGNGVRNLVQAIIYYVAD